MLIFAGGHLHPEERARQDTRPDWLEEVESWRLVWKH